MMLCSAMSALANTLAEPDGRYVRDHVCQLRHCLYGSFYTPIGINHRAVYGAALTVGSLPSCGVYLTADFESNPEYCHPFLVDLLATLFCRTHCDSGSPRRMVEACWARINSEVLFILMKPRHRCGGLPAHIGKNVTGNAAGGREPAGAAIVVLVGCESAVLTTICLATIVPGGDDSAGVTTVRRTTHSGTDGVSP